MSEEGVKEKQWNEWKEILAEDNKPDLQTVGVFERTRVTFFKQEMVLNLGIYEYIY